MGLYDFKDSRDASRILNRVQRLEANVPRTRGGKLQKTSSGLTTVSNSLFDANGKLLLSSSNISNIGSVSPSYNNQGFGVSATDTTATIYWDGVNAGSHIIVLRRADGTGQAIPAGSVTITGLTANTTYYALPFWGPYNKCNIGWILGTAGVPPFLFTSTADLLAAWKQNQANREPLTSTYMTFKTNTTPTSYNPPVTNPAGGTLQCVMQGMEIEPLDNAECEKVYWPEVYFWYLRAGGHWLKCTPNHRLYDGDGFPREARDFEEGDWIVLKEGNFQVEMTHEWNQACTKVEVKMPRVHLYWANHFLSHNVKMQSLPP